MCVCAERERERERERSLTKNRLRGRQAKGDDERKDSVGKIASSSVLVSINSQSHTIGSATAESFAGLLGQCAALAHLDLKANGTMSDLYL